MDSLKIIAVIVITFTIAFVTSFVLDFLPFLENPIKYLLVVLLIFIELYFGWLIYNFITVSKKMD